jgi:hypothetical protein
MSMMPPSKDQDQMIVRRWTITQLRLWQGVGAAVALVGLWIVYVELARQEVLTAVGYTGGPDTRSILIGALIAAAGVASAVWATLTVRRSTRG